MCTAPLCVEAITSVNVWATLAWVPFVPPIWATKWF